MSNDSITPARAGRRGAAPRGRDSPRQTSAVDDPLSLLASLDVALGHIEPPAITGTPTNSLGAAPPAEGLKGAAPPAEEVKGAAPARLAQLPDVYEVCGTCGGPMCRGASNLEYTCADCGYIVEGDTAEPGDDDAPRPAPNTARLRIVGPNSGQLQPDLYRSGSGNTAATQKKQILEEFLAYRQLYIEAKGNAYPLNALSTASEYYNEVQRECVKRSQNKKAIMAACLWRACVSVGYAPAKADVAAFMQLPSKGIARGDNFVRSLVADDKMTIDLDADPSRAEIDTLFAVLGYEGDRYAGLRDAVYAIVQTAIQNNIGTNSILRSKVAGATFVVLRRCRDRALVPKAMSMQEFCQKRIRKNTIERVIRELDDYHSFFEEGYKSAGLDHAPARRPGSTKP